MTSEYSLYTDGACWGNPGKAAAGILIRDCEGSEVFKGSVYIRESTNNIAEYRAVLEGMSVAKEMGIARLKVYSDSQLLVRQLKGEYKVKSQNLAHLKEEALALSGEFEQVNFIHIPRGTVEEPHRLAEGLLKNKN
jgi:ribonuclease HI